MTTTAREYTTGATRPDAVTLSTVAGEVVPVTSTAPGGPPFVSHVTPIKGRDMAYAPDAEEARLPVTVHFRDATTATTVLVLDPDQLYVFAAQVDRALVRRNSRRP